jgi:N6-L-threonylcarbamoyladenine synthase/protein kinase Bud32
MIAVLGARMFEAGDTLAVEDSGVLPDYRPDEVPVTWRVDEPVGRTDGETVVRGAEATVEVGPDDVVKHRVTKGYRHPELDGRLRTERTRSEARTTSEARRVGVPTPVVTDVDDVEASLVLERVGRADLREALSSETVRTVGRHLARLHGAGLVHGDPTPRNVRVGERTYLIDFGLAYYSEDPEDHAMDLHAFEQSLTGTADDADQLRTAVEAAYREAGEAAVLDRLREIEGRGRYQ